MAGSFSVSVAAEVFEAWDPLDASTGIDPGLLIAAQRREIGNILRSYTGYYDLFAELLQNALDAVEKRFPQEGSDTGGAIWIEIDLRSQSVRVTDNGCAMDLVQMRQFLRPNLSFKTGAVTRGSKGVGATYLGYGFNSLEIASRLQGKTYSGYIENGRSWVDDRTGTVARPKIAPMSAPAGFFSEIDQGTSIRVTLRGDNIRPRSLTWYQATTAEQWLALLRIMTPVGGIYLDGSAAPQVAVTVSVIDQMGNETTSQLTAPEYLFPHKIVPRSGSMSEFLAEQQKKVAAGHDPGIISPKFKGLNGLWGQWTVDQLLGEVETDCPIKVSLDDEERALAKQAGLSLYIYLAFSTELWDSLNDKTLRLRKGARVLHGGLQLVDRI